MVSGVSLVAQKTLPAMQETRVQSLGWEDPLQKGRATHSSILVWRIPWTEKPGGQNAAEKVFEVKGTLLIAVLMGIIL